MMCAASMLDLRPWGISPNRCCFTSSSTRFASNTWVIAQRKFSRMQTWYRNRMYQRTLTCSSSRVVVSLSSFGCSYRDSHHCNSTQMNDRRRIGLETALLGKKMVLTSKVSERTPVLNFFVVINGIKFL